MYKLNFFGKYSLLHSQKDIKFQLNIIFPYTSLLAGVFVLVLTSIIFVFLATAAKNC